MNTFGRFSLLSGLKPNKAKSEIAGIGVLKGVSVTLCGIYFTDLTKKNKVYTFVIIKNLKVKRTLSGMFGKYKKY